MNHFYIKDTEFEFVARLLDMNLCLFDILVLFELAVDDAACKGCAVDWHVEVAQHVRNTTDMVFVTVSDYDALYLIDILLEVSDIRDNEVDTEHITIRECHTAVDNDDVVVIFEYGHVFADFLKAAKWNNLQLLAVISIFLCLFSLRFCLFRCFLWLCL